MFFCFENTDDSFLSFKKSRTSYKIAVCIETHDFVEVDKIDGDRKPVKL